MKGKGFAAPIIEGVAYYKVTHLATVYKDYTKIYVPNVPWEKLQPGLELNKILSTISNMTPRGHSINKDENVDRATRRARKDVKELIEYNDFNMWGTLTVSPKIVDRFNPEAVREETHKILKAERRKYPSFAYIVIPELHKNCEECVNLKVKSGDCPHTDRPKAIHFHGFFSNYPDIVPAHNSKYPGQMKRKDKKTGKEYLIFNAPAFADRLGNNDFEIIESKEAVKNYITKYITKDMPTFADKKRYWASKNLERPKKLENIPQFDISAPPPTDKVYINDYGKQYTYNNARLFT